MYLPTKENLLKEYKPKNHLNYSIIDENVLPYLLGLHIALTSSNKSKIIQNIVEDTINASHSYIDDLTSFNTIYNKKNNKKKKIGLFFKITTKGNLTLNWTPLVNEEPINTNSNIYYNSFSRPSNEIFIVKNIYELVYYSNTSQFNNTQINSEQFINTLISQTSLQYLENTMSHYVKKLSTHYDVWALNNISFPSKQKNNPLVINDKSEKISILNNFLNSKPLFLNFEDYSIDLKESFDKSFSEIENDCDRKIEKIKKLNEELSKFNLTSDDLISSIKKQRRQVQKVADKLSLNSGKVITKELIANWINLISDIDEQYLVNKLLNKPAFVDMVTNMDSVLIKLNNKDSKKQTIKI